MAETATNKRDSAILNKLFNIAKTVKPVGRCRVVAAIVRKNKIHAIGFNSFDSSFLARKFADNDNRVYNHAEIAAIKDYIKKYSLEKLDKSTIYIARAKIGPRKRWRTGLAKPCKGCQRAILEFKIKEAIWTNEH